MNRAIVALWITIAATAGVPSASGCPLCLAPSRTWAEVVANSDVVVLARLVSRTEGSDTERPAAVLRIAHVHKGLKLVAAGQILNLSESVFGAVGDEFLVTGSLEESNASTIVETFATDASQQRTINPAGSVRAVAATKVNGQVRNSVEVKQLVWSSPEAASTAAYRYVIEAPYPLTEPRERLLYFLRFLEHEDPLIAADAWGEFAKAEYQDIKALRELFSPQDLKRWIVSERTSPERSSLYGLMLGMCGTPSDAEFLRAQIGDNPDGSLRFGSEGLMGGLLVLNGEPGLRFLEQTRLNNPSAEVFDIFAAVQAIQFVWNHEPACFEKQRLRNAMHPMLQREELREIVIRDLSRWEDWTLVSQLTEIYEACRSEDPRTTRAIIGYLLTFRKAAASAKVPEDAVVAADRLLQQIRRDNARLVRAVERELQ